MCICIVLYANGIKLNTQHLLIVCKGLPEV